MTDATDTLTAAAPVVDAAPEADEGRELVELVGSGWVRMHIGGQRYRLRRPFFGELRKLRILAAEVADEISAASHETTQLGRRIEEHGKAVEDDLDLDPATKAD